MTELEEEKETLQQLPPKHKASTGTGLFARLLHDKYPDTEIDRNQGVWAIGVLWFDKNPGLQAIRERTKERLVDQFYRFRSRLTLDDAGQPVFVECAEIDWDYHIPDLSSKAGGEVVSTEAQLLDYVSRLNDFEYDLDRPLWRYLLLPELENERAAIICCINHAVGDGLSLMDVNSAAYDEQDAVHRQTSSSYLPTTAKGGKPKRSRRRIDWLSKLGIAVCGIASSLYIPFQRPDKDNLLRLPDNVRPSWKKRIALAKPIPLERVREIQSKMVGVTVNDVLMAVMTLTLRALTRGTGTKEIAGQFPISTRPKGEHGLSIETGEPHNKFSFGVFHFDLRPTATRAAVLWATKHQIDVIKLSPAPLVLEQSMHTILKAHPSDDLLNFFVQKNNDLSSVVLSNVPAPAQQVSICGARITGMSFFLFSPLTCYLGVLTYNGEVCASFNLDDAIGVDPAQLAHYWNQEFEQLHAEILNSTEEGEEEEALREPRIETTFYRGIGVATLALTAALVLRAVRRRL